MITIEHFTSYKKSNLIHIETFTPKNIDNRKSEKKKLLNDRYE